MNVSKEKVLLAVVVLAVAGVAAMDSKYVPVPVPSTRAPEDIPAAPEAAGPWRRSAHPEGRSFLEEFSDLVAPPFVELPDLPAPPVPIPLVPVRPWLILDAPIPPPGYRVHFTEPPAGAGDAGQGISDVGTDGGGGAATAPEETAAPAAEEKKPEKIDLANFDWVLRKTGLGQKLYGRITILPEDAQKGRTKYDLLVDPAMELLFQMVNTSNGTFMGPPVRFRSEIDQLGFADTFENNYWTKRKPMEQAAGKKDLDPVPLRALVEWSMAQAPLPKYPRRECWDRAAQDLRAILAKAPSDKEAMKDLGRTLRLLQDLEGELQLYEWWLSSQKIAGDPDVLALSGEVLELLGLRDRARETYEKVLLVQPDPKVRLRLANLELSTGSLVDARRAIETFRRAAQDGERLAGTTGEARALAALGRFEGADGARAVLERIGSPDRDAGWYDAAGAVAYAKGSLDEAKGDFLAAMERAKPGDGQLGIARTNLSVVQGRMGALMPFEGDGEKAARRSALDAAAKTADEALLDDPLNYYWPLVSKGFALRAAGDRDGAVAALQEAVAAWPQEPYGRFLLGEFLLRDGRNAEARTQFLECARLSPRFPDALAGVGRAGGGPPGEAKEYLRRAMQIEPRSSLWPLLAARLSVADEGLAPAQRLAGAQADLNYLLEKVAPSDPLGLVTRGWVRYYQGDAAQTIDDWNRARALLTGKSGSTPWETKLFQDLLEWVKGAQDKVFKWQHTRIFRDTFARPDAPGVGNGWQEEEKQVKLSLKGGAIQYSGQLGPSEVPSLWREFPLGEVLKTSFTVEVAPTEPSNVEICFRIPQSKDKDTTFIGLLKKEDGSVSLHIRKDARPRPNEPEFQDIPDFKWPADGVVEFGFVKMNEDRGILALTLNGKPIAGFEAVEFQTMMKNRSGGKLRCEVRVSGQGGTEVNCRVRAFELWKTVQ